MYPFKLLLRKTITSIISFLFLLLILTSCDKNEKVNCDVSNKKDFSFSNLKNVLATCNRNFDINWSDKLSDSIRLVKLKNNKFLLQNFNGDGCIYIYLIRNNLFDFQILDSLFFYWGEYPYEPIKISYNDTFDWFDFVENGDGTNLYGRSNSLFRVVNDTILQIHSIHTYFSIINPEENPWTFVSFKSNKLFVSKEKIIYHAVYEDGIVINDSCITKRTLSDTLTYLYFDSCFCFVNSKVNATFKKVVSENTVLSDF